MGMIKCTGCERICDAKADPEGWVDEQEHGLEDWKYYCLNCREREIGEGWEEVYADRT